MNISKLQYQPLNLFHVILLSPICQHSVWSELTSHNPLPLKRDQASSLLIALKIRTEQSKLLRSSYSRNKYVVSYVSVTHSRPWCNVNSRGRRQRSMSWKVKAKVYIYLIQRLFVVNHHRRSAQVWHVFSRDFSFTCTPTRSSAIGMSRTCLCPPSYSWYSFTDPEGWKAE